jgi:hypothetical protein
MNKDLIIPMVINQSRRKIAQKECIYYEFSESDLVQYTSDIVKKCASIADMNRAEYELVADAISNLVLSDTGTLIRSHFGIE